jgi:hypothetical protein
VNRRTLSTLILCLIAGGSVACNSITGAGDLVAFDDDAGSYDPFDANEGATDVAFGFDAGCTPSGAVCNVLNVCCSTGGCVTETCP